MPDLSREGPFDPYCAPAGTGDIPLTPMDLPGYRYRMTSYESAEVAHVDPVYGLQLHHPRFLEFVGAPESARFLTRTPSHWVATLDRDNAVSAALQLQHNAGLMSSNLQVLGQFVTSLNRISSEKSPFRRMPWTPFRRCPRHTVKPTTWLRWACGDHRLACEIPGHCRYLLVAIAETVLTVFQT